MAFGITSKRFKGFRSAQAAVFGITRYTSRPTQVSVWNCECLNALANTKKRAFGIRSREYR